MCFWRKHIEDTGMNYLIVGLGNIGDEYSSTRHNIGFIVLDAFAKASNTFFSSQRYGDVAETSYKGRKLYLLKPSTYMNLSGNAVRYWVRKLKLPLSNILIVCDDLNLPFGQVRMRKSGSDGGHNGLKNIQELLGTQEWTRVRVGIGNDFHHGEQVDYVIGKMSQEELSALGPVCERITQGIKDFVTIGPDKTMNSLNIKH